MKFDGRNVTVSPKARLGRDVRLGDNVTIYDGVELGDGSTICNDCVLGEPPAGFYRDAAFVNPPLRIGPGALVRSHSIVYAGSTIGAHLQTGHRVTVREGMTIGDHCSLGTLCDLQGLATLGDYVRLHSNVHVGQKSRLGSYVFIYPYVVLTNDPTPPSEILDGPVVEDFAQIAVMSVVLPGVRIGRHALVGAHALVGKDVPDFMLAVGSPARAVKDVREIAARTAAGDKHYPWPERFSRGMPWAEQGFQAWCRQHGLDEFGGPRAG
jgi:acetyltransferase-like isoleucine patch superfamily enzyme